MTGQASRQKKCKSWNLASSKINALIGNGFKKCLQLWYRNSENIALYRANLPTLCSCCQHLKGKVSTVPLELPLFPAGRLIQSGALMVASFRIDLSIDAVAEAVITHLHLSLDLRAESRFSNHDCLAGTYDRWFKVRNLDSEGLVFRATR